MANEISSSLTRASQPSPPVQDTGQFAKSETSSVNNGKALPAEDKALPREAQSNQTALREAVDQINDYVQTVQRDLSFSMDDESGRTVISVIDSGSGELIRQIPSEEVIALAAHLQDMNQDSVASGEFNRGILFSDVT
jgi:flagellar protein FlaG